MRRLVAALAVLVAVVVLTVPSAGAAPSGQAYLLYGIYLRAQSAQDAVDRAQRSAVDYPTRREMSADLLDSLYADLQSDVEQALSDAKDAAGRAGDAMVGLPTNASRAEIQCSADVYTYTQAVWSAARAEDDQLNLPRSVISAGGTAQQVLDTIQGEPAKQRRQEASDAKGAARRCTS